MKYWFALFLIAAVWQIRAAAVDPGAIYIICDPSNGTASAGSADYNCKSGLATPMPTTLPGLRLNIEWDKLQDGVTACPGGFPCSSYNWSTITGQGSQSIDTFLTNAAANGQKIEIGLGGGGQTPQSATSSTWLICNVGQSGTFTGTISAGASGATISTGSSGNGTFFFQFSDGETRQVTVAGTAVTWNYPLTGSVTSAYSWSLKAAPLPWDATYLSNYEAAITALHTHLGPSGLNILSAVSVIKMGGIDNTTSEFRLPYGGAVDATCAGGNENSAWAAVGYTPTLVKNTYAALVTFYTGLFGTSVNYATDVIFVNAFPAVDNFGNVYVPPPMRSDLTTEQALTTLVTNSALQNYQFIFQWNALDNTPPAPQPAMSYILSLAQFNNVLIGWQANDHGGTGGTGTQCNYGGSATGTYTHTSTSVAISNLTGMVTPGAAVKGGGLSQIASGTTVISYTPATVNSGTLVLSQDPLVNETNAPITFTLFESCSNALITGSSNGDFEQILDTGLGMGVLLEVWGANAPQLQTVTGNIQAKSMRLPN